jgi:hypothetical protein
MLSPFLRAKDQWERGDAEASLATLEQLLGPDSLYVSGSFASERAAGPFEGFVAGLLADDDHLLVPFADAIMTLWRAFPAQYAIDALALRDAISGDARAAEEALLAEAARDGLLTREHERIAQVVPRGEAASSTDYGPWVAAHQDIVASLLLDFVFHRVRVMDRSMVLDRLDRVANRQPELLEPVADTLAGWDPAEVARVGMRVEDPACTGELIAALRSRDFDALPDRCG